MRSRRSKWVSGVGAVLLIGGLLLTSYGPGVTPATAAAGPDHTTILNAVNSGTTGGSTAHSTLQGEHAAQDTAQTTQHTGLSQQITNVQTAVDNLSGADHSGLPPTWDKLLPANDGPDSCHSSRFTCVMGGAAVRDNETGLVWENAPGETDGVPGITAADRLTWPSARFHCVEKNVGGRKAWHQPSFVELASLVDPSNTNPSLPTGHPFTNVQSAVYWSGTTYADDPTNAWRVGFDIPPVGMSYVGTSLKNGFAFFVWCVHGDMNAHQY